MEKGAFHPPWPATAAESKGRIGHEIGCATLNTSSSAFFFLLLLLLLLLLLALFYYCSVGWESSIPSVTAECNSGTELA
jgi:hypothetical protein